MEKLITFEIAKALKDAGYPQKNTEFRYVLTNSTFDHLWFKEGELIDKTQKMSINNLADAPTYIDVWLWLWREKKIYIDINCIQCSEYNSEVSIYHEYGQYDYEGKFTDPVDALIAGINYIVSNQLIKK